MKLKILHSPDLHLYDQEIGHSVGYPEESLHILDEIYDEFIVGDYDIMSLGGDIQHAKISKTKYISAFQKKLRNIGEMSYKRLKERNILDKMIVYDIEGNIIDLSKIRSIIFTNRGQHDTSSVEEFTFFDLLIENKILINPRVVLIEDIQINYINYSKSVDDLKVDKKDNIKRMINIYHNPILEQGYFVDEIIGKTISPEKHNLFKDTDLAIINDIHKPLNIREFASDGKRTTIVTPGSMGRTSFNPSHDRDYGNLVRIDIDSDGNLKEYLIEVELTPAEEFFNKIEVYKQKRVENAFKNFSLEIEDIEMTYFDIHEKIEQYVKDEEIKEICYLILED